MAGVGGWRSVRMTLCWVLVAGLCVRVVCGMIGGLCARAVYRVAGGLCARDLYICICGNSARVIYTSVFVGIVCPRLTCW